MRISNQALICFMISLLLIMGYIYFWKFEQSIALNEQMTNDLGIVERYKTVNIYMNNLEKEINQLKSRLRTETEIKIDSILGNNPHSLTQSHQTLHQTDDVVSKPKETILQIHNLPFQESSLDYTALDPDFPRWKAQLEAKFRCLRMKNGGYFLYHSRKAAGTTVREFLRRNAMVTQQSYFETEGIVLDPSLLNMPGVLSVITLRNPIKRILSLYWYEHVGWYHGVLKKTSRCKSINEWIQAWRDSGELKQSIQAKFPGNNYVEVENYYTKILIGWDGKKVLTDDDLTLAKEKLKHFDIVLITEWINDESQANMLNELFPERKRLTPSLTHKLLGDNKMREQLKHTLNPNEDETTALLTSLNNYDVQLFEYAKSLVSFRNKPILEIYKHVSQTIDIPKPQGKVRMRSTFEHYLPYIIRGDIDNQYCPANTLKFHDQYKRLFSLHQPPGHKGP